jgi:DNA polymerase III delta prime subunit
MGAELHHLPAKDCDLQKVKDLLFALQYVPQRGGRSAPAHVVVVDEADEMTWGAQTAFLSLLDETEKQAGDAGSLVHAGLSNVNIFIFTANNPAKLEERFRSRCQPVEFDADGIVPTELAQRLREIWLLESGELAGAPDFAAIVRECKGNVRCAVKRLERELMLAAGAQQWRFPKFPNNSPAQRTCANWTTPVSQARK